MEQLSPLAQKYARRPRTPTSPDLSGGKASNGDPRWFLLDQVKRCRNALGLRDRDITVLRGLLSFVGDNDDTYSRVVFASNRTLIDRCDGIDERTLRRRIEHLSERGLVSRRSSPNGKRYRVIGNGVQLAYGIDLSPLFHLRDRLVALAEQCQRDEVQKKALKSVIRDLLFHHGHRLSPEAAEVARLTLRRSLSVAELEAFEAELRAAALAHCSFNSSEPTELSVRDSQNDRHIQSSSKENNESECVAVSYRVCERKDEDPEKAGTDRPPVSIGECRDLAKNAFEFASGRPETWREVLDLSSVLAPAIGISRGAYFEAKEVLGAYGCALAVLGLVEAVGRVRSPSAYLTALLQQARKGDVSLRRMFVSLTRPKQQSALRA